MFYLLIYLRADAWWVNDVLHWLHSALVLLCLIWSSGIDVQCCLMVFCISGRLLQRVAKSVIMRWLRQ